MKTNRLIYLILSVTLFVLSFGCSQQKYVNHAGLVSQINRYYDNLHDPMDYNRSVKVLYSNTAEHRKSVLILGAYLISKGYTVKKIGAPKYLQDDKNDCVYEVQVEISYPRDSFAKDIPPLSTAEKVWIDKEQALITKIQTSDKFISSRALNYIFTEKY